MSTKIVATIAAAALPMAVSAGDPLNKPTFVHTTYTDDACTTVATIPDGQNPNTYLADDSCVDTSVGSKLSSAKFTCDGTTVTSMQYQGKKDCTSTGVQETTKLGECTKIAVSESETAYIEMTDYKAGGAGGGGDDGADGPAQDGGADGPAEDDGGDGKTSSSSSGTVTSSSAPLAWFIAAASAVAVCLL